MKRYTQCMRANKHAYLHVSSGIEPRMYVHRYGGVPLGDVVVFTWVVCWCSPGCGGGVHLGDVAVFPWVWW